MLILSVHHHTSCNKPGLLVNNHWPVNMHWCIQAVKGLCYIFFSFAVAFHSDLVARHHLTFCHTDSHQEAKHVAFVLRLSPFMLFPSPFVLLLLPFVLLLSLYKEIKKSNYFALDLQKKIETKSKLIFLLLLSPFHKLVCSCQVPGNIRRAEHFVAFLRRFVAYLKEKLGVNQVETENPTTFLAQLQERLNIDGMGCHYI